MNAEMISNVVDIELIQEGILYSLKVLIIRNNTVHTTPIFIIHRSHESIQRPLLY